MASKTSKRAVIRDRHLNLIAELIPLIGARSTSAAIDFMLEVYLADELEYQRTHSHERKVKRCRN